jgi:hypothetical protein
MREARRAALAPPQARSPVSPTFRGCALCRPGRPLRTTRLAPLTPAVRHGGRGQGRPDPLEDWGVTLSTNRSDNYDH